MALSNAERQRRYRQRHYVDGTKVRLDLAVSAHASAALRRLARHRSLPVTAVIEHVASEAESAAVDGMSRKDRLAYFADLD
jgi:hypothetical protein